MAWKGDNSFKRILNSACSSERSKAQMSVGKIFDTVYAAAAVVSPNSQPDLHQDEGLEGENLVGSNDEKRGLLNIDLNVALPVDGGFESPSAREGGNGREIRPTVEVDVASETKVGSVNEHRLNLNGIQSHWSKVENNGFCMNMIGDSEVEAAEEEEDRKIRGWKKLLEVAETALRQHEEKRGNKEEKFQNLKRKTSRESELGDESHEATARKKITGLRRQSYSAEWIDETEAAAAAVLGEPVVVRSTRGRAVAMPHKYRDSVLDAAAEAAEAELPRHNKSGNKSAAVVSTKRKSR